MSIATMLGLMLIIYLERDVIDKVGERIWARIRFELTYHSIKRSIRKENRKWG